MPILFDSSIYISALRLSGNAPLLLRRWANESPVWLSSVVLEELYAGAHDRARLTVERLERDFDRVNRILVPTLGDWTKSGRLLGRMAAKYQYENIGLGRLTNDALIATSAGRMGATVVTANGKDFSRLAEFHVFEWEVAKL